jgi:hypothetical protein
MDGRWTIKQTRTRYGVIQWIGGAKVPREATPVVPCDDAAVERVARVLCRQRCYDWDTAGGLLRTALTAAAVEVLNAAGEVSS